MSDSHFVFGWGRRWMAKKGKKRREHAQKKDVTREQSEVFCRVNFSLLCASFLSFISSSLPTPRNLKVRTLSFPPSAPHRCLPSSPCRCTLDPPPGLDTSDLRSVCKIVPVDQTLAGCCTNASRREVVGTHPPWKNSEHAERERGAHKCQQHLLRTVATKEK